MEDPFYQCVKYGLVQERIRALHYPHLFHLALYVDHGVDDDHSPDVSLIQFERQNRSLFDDWNRQNELWLSLVLFLTFLPLLALLLLSIFVPLATLLLLLTLALWLTFVLWLNFVALLTCVQLGRRVRPNGGISGHAKFESPQRSLFSLPLSHVQINGTNLLI